MMTHRPTVLITGAAVRLGKATAQAFFKHGCNLMLHYNQSESAAKALCDSFNQQRPESCQTVQADLSCNEGNHILIETCLDSFNRLDHLVNNASIFYPTPVESTDVSIMGDFLKTNWQAPVNLIRYAQRELNKSQGSIINLIDIYAERGLSGHGFYVASKSALLASTKALAHELSPRIRVNAVSPGAILWPEKLQSNSPISDEEIDARDSIIQNTALKRLGSASNIAETIVYLALDASYTTGSLINVDGGRSDYI